MTETLTRDAVLAMEAGPEMDMLVAERVMGFCRADIGGVEFWLDPKPGTGMRAVHAWQPSTDIAAAWEVVEKAKSLDDSDGYRRCYFTITQTAIGFGVMYQHKNDEGDTTRHLTASAPTAPLAICRAALLATLEAA